MENLISQLRRDYPALVFRGNSRLCWSPNDKQISYPVEGGKHALSGLLHELGHALLGHDDYTSDVELLKKEVEAWQKARTLAETYGVAIAEGHIEDCLDTYRDWIHKRCLCPQCSSAGLQESRTTYRCINCNKIWVVSVSRFHRPYRRLTQQKDRA